MTTGPRGATALPIRLSRVVDALPLTPGMRVLEIGCGPGAATREVARRVGPGGHVLGIDRSERAIRRARRAAVDLVAAGRLDHWCLAIEDLTPTAGTSLFDLAFAVRVGVFDGRHPETLGVAMRRVRTALAPGGRLFVDSPDPAIPLREFDLDDPDLEPA